MQAKQRGAKDEALHWLKRSKDMRSFIDGVLDAFPDPETVDVAAVARRASPSEPAKPASPPPEPAPKPAPPPAAPVAAAGRPATPPLDDADGDPDAANAYAEAVVSYQVLAWEIEQLGGAPSPSDDDELKLDALETRKVLLEAAVGSGELTMGAYLDRLRKAIPAEKASAARHKAAGQTAGALHALRRAKMMTTELAEAEQTAGES